MSLVAAHKKYGITKQALWKAIKRGALPVKVIQVSEVRLNPKDVAAYVAAIPEWRRVNGRKGGLKGGFTQQAIQRRLTAAAKSRHAAAG